VISEIFADFDCAGSPGATLAVARDGDVMESHSFGEANVEHGAPNARDTVFYIASTSKQFVGCAIALLEADSALDVDADVGDYLPELHRFDSTVRVRNLLHHTSGIRDKYALNAVGRLPEETISTDFGSMALLARQRSLHFEPGSRFMYSNSNYFLLAQIVERVSGMSFADFTRTRIFGPLGMAASRFRDDASVVIANRASGYRRGRDGSWHLAEYTWNSLGPGGVVTTVDDLAKWATTYYDNRLEPADLGARMLRTEPLADGRPNTYAFGVMVDSYRGLTAVSHAGGVSGFAAEMITFPDHHLSVICLANTSVLPAAQKAREVAALHFGDALAPLSSSSPGEPVGDARFDVDAFAGTYLTADESAVFRVMAQADGGVVLQAGGQVIPVAMVGSAHLRTPAGTDVELSGDALVLTAPGPSEPVRCARVEEQVLDVAALDAVAGEYRSPELGASLHVRRDGEALRAEWPWHPPAPMRALGLDLFLALVGVDGNLGEIPMRFVRDAGGSVTGLQISIDRALGNRFERVPPRSGE